LRLFRAWSNIDQFLEQEQVRMEWFVVGRTEPPAPWDQIIEDYDANDDNAAYDQLMANELLSEGEIEQLKIYLEGTHQLELTIEEVKLPIKSGGLSHGLLLINGVKGFYPLAEEEGYPLEVSILGHYDCEIPDTPRCLSAKELDAGIKFLECLSANFSREAPDKAKDHELLQKIYAETGLKVVRD
jgi:hypothetical protein